MADNEIRMFQIGRGRNGDINFAVLCNGRNHFVCQEGLDYVPNVAYMHNTHCDGKACVERDSEVLDISQLSIANQGRLGLEVSVPAGLVLVAKTGMVYSYYSPSIKVYSSGESVTPKQLNTGTLVEDGAGATFTMGKQVYYVRNATGKARVKRVGRKNWWLTTRKLKKLRATERKSEVSYDANYLTEMLQELLQLHRTPEVTETIEKVKELLRLASSLSTEASIEAAEGFEGIARELASSRAREIDATLGFVSERLMLEKTAREETIKELSKYWT